VVRLKHVHVEAAVLVARQPRVGRTRLAHAARAAAARLGLSRYRRGIPGCPATLSRMARVSGRLDGGGALVRRGRVLAACGALRAVVAKHVCALDHHGPVGRGSAAWTLARESLGRRARCTVGTQPTESGAQPAERLGAAVGAPLLSH